jgi:hypothetical protein
MRWTLGAIAGCALVALVAGCTSSGGGPSGSSPPGPLPATDSSTGVPTTSSTSPTPTPSKSTPLSRFEGDPGVAALRDFAAASARTINSGRYISPQLRTLMTPTVAKEMKQTNGPDVGLHYPGPVPFTPLRVAVTSTTSRRIDACWVSTGFAQKPQANKPAKPLKLIAVRSEETMTHGKWLLSVLLAVDSFSCRGVHVPMPTF